ncbi:LOW QUALITY PROTEIN: hypothetical protein OSB04_019918 [Centaurea solstitialis]|uniref:Uncharacterized protein n=1 Tax=Centaurea solstitialis TaxID=347529 RepID=A0AA38T3G1_9ASTR|nr:LOW QUALITY PROTEIN: hypothetical protein OSB04_019918 [Centaurea solstitialis]
MRIWEIRPRKVDCGMVRGTDYVHHSLVVNLRDPAIRNPTIVSGFVEKDDSNFTPEEANCVRGDLLAKSYLIQSQHNEIYANIDCNNIGKAIQLHGTKKGVQMKKTNLLTKFATFKGREGELFEDTYHRFCNMINELGKNDLKNCKSTFSSSIHFGLNGGGLLQISNRIAT